MNLNACIAMLNGTEPSPAAKELIKMMSSGKQNLDGN